METTVKQPKRDRQSQRRARTRRAVLDAASRLFAERGYAAATMEAIAEAADVAAETVYVRFGSKRNLLAAYLDVSVVGDDEPVPLLEREPVRAVAAETDQRRQIRLLAHLARTILQSADPAQRVLAGAAAADRALEELAAADDQRRRITHRAFIDMLARNGPLRDGLSTEDAVDTYSALSNPGTYAFLTRRRGWPADRFETWIADCFERLLLPDPARQAGGSRDRIAGQHGEPDPASRPALGAAAMRTGQTRAGQPRTDPQVRHDFDPGVVFDLESTTDRPFACADSALCEQSTSSPYQAARVLDTANCICGRDQLPPPRKGTAPGPGPVREQAGGYAMRPQPAAWALPAPPAGA